MYLYLNALSYCGVLLHNDLLGCNYYDTTSPHNAMHSSSISHMKDLLLKFDCFIRVYQIMSVLLKYIV